MFYQSQRSILVDINSSLLFRCFTEKIFRWCQDNNFLKVLDLKV